MKVAVRKLEVENAARLQSLVVEHVDGIEDGLAVLDARLLLGHATIDIIGLDASGALVLMAVGFSANEEMILKAVEAYSWCLEYPDAIRRLYPGCQVSEARPPRLMFIAERLPDAFQRKIKQLGFPEVDCIEFRYLDVAGSPAVYFEPIVRMRRPLYVSEERTEAPAHGSASEPARGGGDAVPTAHGGAVTARATSVKLQKLLNHSEPTVTASVRGLDRAVAAPVREPATVVRMISRQNAVAVPRLKPVRPRVAGEEPVALHEPIAAPVVVAEPEPESETAAAVAADGATDAQVVAAVEAASEPVNTSAAVVESFEAETTVSAPAAIEMPPVAELTPESPGTLGEPVVEPVTAPSPAADERVSFAGLAEALLGALAAAPQAGPAAAEAQPAVAVPAQPAARKEPVISLKASKTISDPLPRAKAKPATSPAEPVAMTEEAAVAEMKAATVTSGLPAELEGLKVSGDGALTRQWLEFLNQMAAK